MNTFFSLLAVLCLLAVPVLFVMLIVRAIRKKPKKLCGFSLLGAIVLFFVCVSLATSCSHEWTAATCTAPETCSLCADTRGEPIAHNWSPATCEKAPTCVVCGQTQGEPIAHTVAEWSIVREATCSQTGTEEGSCSVCGNVSTREIPTTEHTPGEWVVTTPATATSNGVRSNSCTVCAAALDTETFELSAEEAEAQYKAACNTYTYQEIARNPNEYSGKYAKFAGEVIQVQQEELAGMMFYVLRVNVTKSGQYISYYEDTVYVTYTADADAARILEKDIITMYGELKGEKTYTSVLGSAITIPSFDAEYIDIH